MTSNLRRIAMLGSVGVIALVLPGCLKRTISVTSTPPGAIVWINDVEVGRTPLETDFSYYGHYDVRVRREGYEPVYSSRKAKAPIYEAPAIDLVAEAVPTTIETTIAWHFDLVPVGENGEDKLKAEQDLIARANGLRTELVSEKEKKAIAEAEAKKPAPEESAAPAPANQ